MIFLKNSDAFVQQTPSPDIFRLNIFSYKITLSDRKGLAPLASILKGRLQSPMTTRDSPLWFKRWKSSFKTGIQGRHGISSGWVFLKNTMFQRKSLHTWTFQSRPIANVWSFSLQIGSEIPEIVFPRNIHRDEFGAFWLHSEGKAATPNRVCIHVFLLCIRISRAARYPTWSATLAFEWLRNAG